MFALFGPVQVRWLTCYGPLPLCFDGFEAAVSAPCGRVANARFLAGLSSDLDGVWLFRISHPLPPNPIFVCVCAGSVAYTCYGPLPLCFDGFEAAVSAACGRVANARFLAGLSSDLDGVWLFRISHPLPPNPIFVCVCAGSVAYTCYGPLPLCFDGFEAAVSAACGRVANARFLAGLSSDLDGVWLFRISHPLPPNPIFVCVCAGSVAYTCYGPLPLCFDGFEAAVSAACGRVANARFLLRLSSDLGGVWLFRTHCPEAAILPLSRLGCVTFFV